MQVNFKRTMTRPQGRARAPAETVPFSDAHGADTLELEDSKLSSEELTALVLRHVGAPTSLGLTVTSPDCSPDWLSALIDSLGTSPALTHLKLRDVKMPGAQALRLANTLRSNRSIKTIGLGGSVLDDFTPVLEALATRNTRCHLMLESVTLWGPGPVDLDACSRLLRAAIVADRITAELVLDGIPWSTAQLDELIGGLESSSSLVALQILDTDSLTQPHRCRIAQLRQRNADRQLLVNKALITNALQTVLSPLPHELRTRVAELITEDGTPAGLWSARGLALGLDTSSRDRTVRLRSAGHRAALQKALEHAKQMACSGSPDAINTLHHLARLRIRLNLAGARLVPDDDKLIADIVSTHPMAASIHRIQEAHTRVALDQLMADARDFASSGVITAGISALEHLTASLREPGAPDGMEDDLKAVCTRLEDRITRDLVQAGPSVPADRSATLRTLSKRLESIRRAANALT